MAKRLFVASGEGNYLPYSLHAQIKLICQLVVDMHDRACAEQLLVPGSDPPVAS